MYLPKRRKELSVTRMRMPVGADNRCSSSSSDHHHISERSSCRGLGEVVGQDLSTILKAEAADKKVTVAIIERSNIKTCFF